MHSIQPHGIDPIIPSKLCKLVFDRTLAASMHWLTCSSDDAGDVQHLSTNHHHGHYHFQRYIVTIITIIASHVMMKKRAISNSRYMMEGGKGRVRENPLGLSPPPLYSNHASSSTLYPRRSVGGQSF